MLPVDVQPTQTNRANCVCALRWCLMAIVCLPAGCRLYGGRYQTITLVTDPPNAIAYTMTYEVWREHGGRDVLSNNELLEVHRVKSALTPVKHDLLPYEHVFVAEWDGHRDFIRFTPKAGKAYILTRPTTSETR